MMSYSLLRGDLFHVAQAVSPLAHTSAWVPFSVGSKDKGKGAHLDSTWCRTSISLVQLCSPVLQTGLS